MVVVDSSALIPLARIGRLGLIDKLFEEVHTTVGVREEVLSGDQPGAAALGEYLKGTTVHPAPDGADRLADLEGIATVDASVLIMARELSTVLLANDKALIEVARSQGLECWWVTTVLLSATKTGTLDAGQATEALFELVDDGMYLHPKVYARVQAAMEDLED